MYHAASATNSSKDLRNLILRTICIHMLRIDPHLHAVTAQGHSFGMFPSTRTRKRAWVQQNLPVAIVDFSLITKKLYNPIRSHAMHEILQ